MSQSAPAGAWRTVGWAAEQHRPVHPWHFQYTPKPGSHLHLWRTFAGLCLVTAYADNMAGTTEQVV